MLDIKTTNSPTLAAGAIDITFGEMEKVENAYVYFENPAISDYVFDAETSVSGNTVTVTVSKLDVTAAAAAAWGNAASADLNGFDLVVVAKGI